MTTPRRSHPTRPTAAAHSRPGSKPAGKSSTSVHRRRLGALRGMLLAVLAQVSVACVHGGESSAPVTVLEMDPTIISVSETVEHRGGAVPLELTATNILIVEGSGDDPARLTPPPLAGGVETPRPELPPAVTDQRALLALP